MIINQPELFKTWLTAVLKPMCDADPAALAKYVLALVRKDKSGDELHKLMVSQLNVFLEQETETFVNLVLHTLETQDYLSTPVIPNANPPNPLTVKSKESSKTIVQPNELPNLNDSINGNGTSGPTSGVVTPSPAPAAGAVAAPLMNSKREFETSNRGIKDYESSKREREGRRSDSDKRRHRSGSRNRSRSRSWDRSKRSRSKEAKRERSRTWRNKSPPSRRYERRRSRSTSRLRSRSRSHSPRSRSPKYRSSRYRNRTPPRSPQDKRLATLPGTPTQDSNHGDLDMRLTNSTQSIQSVVVQQQQQQQQQNQSTTNQGINMTSQSASKRRCRDFDEKGYCMRGEMCPFDHGVDPVVLEDAQLTSVLTYNPNNPPNDVQALNVAAAVAGGPPPNIMAGSGGHPLIGAPRGIPPEYNPQAPHIWNRTGFRGPRPSLGLVRGPPMGFNQTSMNMQRELIQVPVLDGKMVDYQNNLTQHNTHHQPYQHNQHHNHHRQQQQQQQQQNYNKMDNDFINSGGINKKKSFDYNRLGPRSKNVNNNNNALNCSLELKKIPHGLNTITHLNNHFSKFGKAINIQVNYDGDPEAAIITFSSHAEANAAYRSTEAVLNNRFIKVFWHCDPLTSFSGKQENVPPQTRSVKERLGIMPQQQQQQQIVAPNTNKVLNLLQPKADDTNDNNNIEKEKLMNKNNVFNKTINNATTLNKDETKAQQAAAIKKNQELLAVKEKLKKNQDEQRKEVLKIKNNLRKRKQELLEKQLTQQKVLIEKMEKLSSGPQRDLIIETIKKAQEAIEEIKKDLTQSVKSQSTITPTTTTTTNQQQHQLQQQQHQHIPLKKAKDDVQREMLDAELDLITKQQEGGDTTAIQKKLFELKAKAAAGSSLLLLRNSGILNNRGRRFNPISRHLLSKNNLLVNNKKTSIINKSKNVFQKHTVDHRPTRILISGYEIDEQSAVLAHFQTFGDIIDYIIDETLPSITLNYKTRKEAEIALLKGKHFQDRTLSITWSNLIENVNLQRQTSTGSNGNDTKIISNNHNDNDDENSNKILIEDEDRLIEHTDETLIGGNIDDGIQIGPELTEDQLLQDDEEEEEENEDRSWRR